jgi:hypothetical protein
MISLIPKIAQDIQHRMKSPALNTTESRRTRTRVKRTISTKSRQCLERLARIHHRIAHPRRTQRRVRTRRARLARCGFVVGFRVIIHHRARARAHRTRISMHNISMRLIRAGLGRVDARAGRRGGASRRRACAGRHHRSRIARLNVRLLARDVVSRDARRRLRTTKRVRVSRFARGACRCRPTTRRRVPIAASRGRGYLISRISNRLTPSGRRSP